MPHDPERGNRPAAGAGGDAARLPESRRADEDETVVLGRRVPGDKPPAAEPPDLPTAATVVAGQGGVPVGEGASLAAGQRVLGRFVLVRQLGRGGMGVVWLARDEELERDVALKFLPGAVVHDRAAVADLKRETRRALELTHPHIVRVHDFHQEGELAGISMEYVDGETLTALRLDRPGRVFEPDALLPWVAQLADALDYAHERARVVHRDLKPANLMVNGRGDLKVTDFGISATITDTMTRVSRVADGSGTPAYASPQQLMGEAPSPADDVYALGATLYELVTGKPPFYTGNLVLQVQTRRPPSLSERRGELGVDAGAIPSAWEATIAACLEKDPVQRPASAGEVLARLQGSEMPARAPQPAAAATAELPVPGPRPPRGRSRRWVWLFGLLAFASVAAAGVWLADVPNRIRASMQAERGHRALVMDDWPAAMTAFREAALLRPTDLAHRKDYDDVQSAWLDQLGRELERMTPTERAAHLATEPVQAIGRDLGESHGAVFRKLVSSAAAEVEGLARARAAEALALAGTGNFTGAYDVLDRMRSVGADPAIHDEAFAQVRDLEQRARVEAAVAMAAEGNTAGAVAALDGLAENGLLADEVARARAGVRLTAARGSVERLVRAVRAGDVGAVRAILETAGRVRGAEAEAAASTLVRADTLSAFLAGLSQAGFELDPADQSAGGLEIAMVEGLRDRFGDRATVQGYLAPRYLAWARVLYLDRQPAFALFALERAQAEGAVVDAGLAQEARVALARDLDVAVVVGPVAQSGSRQPLPGDDLRAAAADILRGRVGAWIDVTELRPSGSTGLAVELRMTAEEISTRDDTSRETLSQRYQSGWKNVPNPEYQKTEAELKETRARAADLEKQLREAQAGRNNMERVVGALLTVRLKNEYNRAVTQATELQAKLSRTPSTLREPAWSEEPYARITHNLTYGVEIATTMHRGSSDLAPWLVWSASRHHRTVEVAGNAARGVPVQAPAYPPMSDVARDLTRDLVAEMRADAASLVNRVQIATFTALESALQEAHAGAGVVAARRWGLAHLWRSSGEGVRQLDELERDVREQLGLPEPLERAQADVSVVRPSEPALPRAGRNASPAPRPRP